MLYRAHFEPQAWIKDHAVTVDAEGEQTWDCTAFIEANLALKADVDVAIKRDGYFLDSDDLLMRDDNAPVWVVSWQGPFTITVSAEEVG